MNNLFKLKTESNRYQLWLRQAEFDLKAAEVSFQAQYYEWTTYQCEQAVEKALKAVIIHAGYIPPKMHKISILIGYCNSLNENFRKSKFHFHRLDSFTFISRYPFVFPGSTLTPHEQIRYADGKLLIEQATDFLIKIKGILEQGKTFENGGFEGAHMFDPASIDIEKRIAQVVQCLRDGFDPEKIILFGSYAREQKPKNITTIDVLIIAKTDLDFISRIQLARKLTKGGLPSVEPIVYTPEEFRIMMDEESEGFLEMALSEGKVLYERTPNSQ